MSAGVETGDQLTDEELGRLASRVGSAMACAIARERGLNFELLEEMQAEAIIAAWRAVASFEESHGLPVERWMALKARSACLDYHRSQDWMSRGDRSRAKAGESLPPASQRPLHIEALALSFGGDEPWFLSARSLLMPGADEEFHDAQLLTELADVIDVVLDRVDAVARSRSNGAVWHSAAFRMWLAGWTLRSIGVEFGVSQARVMQVVQSVTSKVKTEWQQSQADRGPAHPAGRRSPGLAQAA